VAVGLGQSPAAQDLAHQHAGFWARVETPAADRDAALGRWLEAEPAAAAALVAAATRAGWLSAAELAAAGASPADRVFCLWEKAQRDAGLRTALLASGDPAVLAFQPFLRGRAIRHWLGTDDLGRDELLRLIYGARLSMGVALLVALGAGLVGLLCGVLAGYHGGWWDAVLMRVTDILLSLPILPLLIIFAAMEFQKIPLLGRLPLDAGWASVVKVVVILVLFSWMPVARVVRGSTLTVREQDYVLAARAVGARDGWIIGRHIVPNVLGPFLVAVTLTVGAAIVAEAALSYLGLGVQGGAPSWGRMLHDAREVFTKEPRLALLPGTLICLAVVSVNFVGDGLRDALDPRLAVD
jgi:peptide/nickel transport system permease protein